MAKMTNTLSRTIQLVEKLYGDCLKDGTLKQIGSKYDYIYDNTFRAWVTKNLGIDHHTIKSYRTLFESYKFLRFDDYRGTVDFIFRESPDYIKYKAGGNLRSWF